MMFSSGNIRGEFYAAMRRKTHKKCTLSPHLEYYTKASSTPAINKIFPCIGDLVHYSSKVNKLDNIKLLAVNLLLYCHIHVKRYVTAMTLVIELISLADDVFRVTG